MLQSCRTFALLTAAVFVAGPALAGQTRASAAERDARQAQRDFEAFRREHLPLAPMAEGSCDISFGRLCTGTDATDTPLSEEGDEIGDARAQLRRSLRELDARSPGSDFIVGQRVRYALEAHDYPGARGAAADCRATGWWCLALRGLAAHDAGNDIAAAASYDSALGAMPDALRCRWLDVRVWLPPGMGTADETPPCATRRALAHRVFWLAAPMLTWHPRAARDEFLSRRTMERIVAGTAIPRALEWGSDIAEIRLRYGWPVRFSRQPSEGDLSQPGVSPVVEHLPAPSFSLVPDRHALDAPLEAHPDDWQLQRSVRAPMLYAPGWIKAIGALPVQIARFRRGADMLIVAGYDAAGTLDGPRQTRRAALLLTTGPDSTIGRADAAASELSGALAAVAPARRALAAVEVIDSARALAMRWRGAVAPLPDSLLISDLLIGTAAGGALSRTLAGFLPHALGRLRVTAGDTLALYWELYANASIEQPVPVSLRLVRVGSGLMHGLGRLFGMSGAAPAVSLTWEDRGAPRQDPSRTLRVAIPGVPPGRYRLEIVVDANPSLGTAAAEIDVVDPRDAQRHA